MQYLDECNSINVQNTRIMCMQHSFTFVFLLLGQESSNFPVLYTETIEFGILPSIVQEQNWSYIYMNDYTILMKGW